MKVIKRMNPVWKPRADGIAMLNFAMAQIKSVPYKVSSRWTFYQLVQSGFIKKVKVCKFDYLLSKARKNFYGDWRPDTLTDTIRHTNFKGEFSASFGVSLDSVADQDYYVQLWFEAEAMHGQFEYHTHDYRVSLIPFRGDCSIPIKWALAKKLEAIGQKYNKPIKILYFGDCDKKGFQILEAALKDIRAWCNTEFDVERIGLTLEQARELNIPENPDKPDSYQWEALGDERAGKLILSGVTRYLKPVSLTQQDREKAIESKIRPKFVEILNMELGANYT